MKPAVVCHLPAPQGGLTTEAFLKNLGMFKRTHPAILYSEHAWPGRTHPLKNELQKMLDKTRPLNAKLYMNNLAFLTGARIALVEGYSHMLYLEADCRMKGDHWDKRIIDEFTGQPSAMIGGTLVISEPEMMDAQGQERAGKLIAANTKDNFPVRVFRHTDAEHKRPLVFVMGALGIYDLGLLKEFFGGLTDTINKAKDLQAWDVEIGKKLWEQLSSGTFEAVANLRSVFSSYGDGVTTPEERRAMLTEGKVVAMHQEKTDWIPA